MDIKGRCLISGDLVVNQKFGNFTFMNISQNVHKNIAFQLLKLTRMCDSSIP